jgi:hypothetical protein
MVGTPVIASFSPVLEEGGANSIIRLSAKPVQRLQAAENKVVIDEQQLFRSGTEFPLWDTPGSQFSSNCNNPIARSRFPKWHLLPIWGIGGTSFATDNLCGRASRNLPDSPA